METVHLKGSSTIDVIQMYYAERYKEQEALNTKRQPLVVNVSFIFKNKTIFNKCQILSRNTEYQNTLNNY